MSKILAIDYGLKRIGIAITDPMQIIASPVGTVDFDDIFAYLEKIVSKEPISTIVVGLPVNLNLTETHLTKHTVHFVEKLKTHFPKMNIVTIDERFTSKIASSVIHNSNLGKNKRRDKSNIDKISACIILQSYLEKMNNDSEHR